MKNNRINIRQKILLPLFGILAAVILIEIALRLLGAAYSMHDTLKNKAVLTGNLKSRPVRILCLGACYTVGVGVNSEETYPSYLGQILRRNYPEKSFVIINKAIRGKSSSYFVNNLEKFILKFNPQILILDVNGMTNLDAANLLLSNKHLYGFWGRTIVWLDSFLNRLKVYQITRLALTSNNQAEAGEESVDKLLPAEQEDIYALEIKHLLDGLKKEPNNAELLKKLTFAYAKRGLFEDAIETIKKAAESNKNNFDLYCQMFKFLIISGQYVEAIELQKKILISYPLNIGALCQKINICEVARNIHPGSIDEVLLSQQYALIGRYKEAIKTAEDIKKRSKKKRALKSDYGNKQVIRMYKYLPGLLDFYRTAQKLTDNPADGNALASAYSINAAGKFYERKKNPVDPFASKAGQRKKCPAKASAAEMANCLLRRDLSEAKRISTEHGIAILIENMGSFWEQQESMKNICREIRLPLADVFGYFYNAADRKSFFFPFPSYKRLNQKGNRQMAQQIYNALIEYGILSGPKN